MRFSWAAAMAAVSLFAAAGAHAQAVDQKKFNVVGTWNFLTNWKVLEVPFWEPGAAGRLGRQAHRQHQVRHRAQPQGH